MGEGLSDAYVITQIALIRDAIEVNSHIDGVNARSGTDQGEVLWRHHPIVVRRQSWRGNVLLSVYRSN